ncbi:16S rRNA processing protein rimM [Spiroplasma clarkii]|uniref:Ribosome maturation factor RimM n=1 Tax=Spiroplasma clarkii TaxID=2139 RepID=A0A1Y0L225_9MOLU|nr:ribosome maturation factor RimM [Spiroplasma clarkii]ARU92061.1 16S rRNA processing protein rimM [Spiroplasma clarkii]ATX71390.1 16S rRNA processing protein RimM [Spiroplasma clarkii]
MSLLKQLTEIGVLKATHGIKGEFKLWINDDIIFEHSPIGNQLFLQDKKNNFDVYTVEKFYSVKVKQIVKFKEINTIDQAKGLVGQQVFVKTDQNLITVKTTLLGFAVYCQEKLWGHVIELMNNGAYELIKVKNNQVEFWVPCVDKYIVKIDKATNSIYAIDLEMLQ